MVRKNLRASTAKATKESQIAGSWRVVVGVHEVQLSNASFIFEKVTRKKNMCIVGCGGS